MKDNTNVTLFRRLNRLFRNGAQLRKKIKSRDTSIAIPDNTTSSGMLLFQKSSIPSYSSVTTSAYNLSERMMRYQDSQEMEYCPELAAALDIVADECVPQDERGRILHVFSENEKIKELLDDLYFNVLNVDFNLRGWIRNLVKYGDFFLYNDVSPEYGIMNVIPIPVNEVEREENYDRNDPFAVRFRWNSLGNRILENWEVSHFRLISNDMFLPYGSSMLEPARRIWRQLILMEDAMLVYRIVRAPERRVFYLDVGNIPADEVEAYVEKQKQQLKSSKIMTQDGGRADLRYNPLDVEEDYFIPIRSGDTGTKIDTLAGGQNAAAIEDVEYLQKKLIASLKIPRAYLGYEDALSSKSTLSQEDIRFARTINSIQKMVISELNKLAIIHLFAHGFTNEDLMNFNIHLTNPSTIAEQQKLELWRTRFEIIDAAPKDLLTSRWLSKNILNLTDIEIRDIQKEQQLEGGGGEESESSGGGGGGALFGGGGGGDLGTDEADLGSDEEETPDFGDLGDLVGGEEDTEEPEEELTAAIDRDDEDLRVASHDHTTSRIKPVSPEIKKSNHRRYVRHQKSGRADVGLSDMSKLVDYDKNPFSGNPFAENVFIQSDLNVQHQKTMLARSPDMLAMFTKMSERNFGTNKCFNKSIIKEQAIDIQKEIDDTNVKLDFNNLIIIDDKDER